MLHDGEHGRCDFATICDDADATTASVEQIAAGGDGVVRDGEGCYLNIADYQGGTDW